MHDFKFQMSALRFPFDRVDGAMGALVETLISGGARKGLFDVESPKLASGPRSWILSQTVSKVQCARDGGMNVTCSSLSAMLATACVWEQVEDCELWGEGQDDGSQWLACEMCKPHKSSTHDGLAALFWFSAWGRSAWWSSSSIELIAAKAPKLDAGHLWKGGWGKREHALHVMTAQCQKRPANRIWDEPNECMCIGPVHTCMGTPCASGCGDLKQACVHVVLL